MGYALRRPEHEHTARMTTEEFLDFEERSPERHFHIDGVAVAMSGGTYEQSAITSNVNAACHAKLSGTPCRTLESNMKVKLGASNDLVFSDGLIVCGEPTFLAHPTKRLVLLNRPFVF